ncbi:hypothetical protein DDB_G0285771 [Dictyostelium discoideum AX4]|uniref:Transmembrane protein n=1 Tax=Dictyostelium discoideum TaxID=44689 RepID=Q54MX4_DICDI|nr:hypothetical protein DDB_G0285771 [Dictyostelium discoideum AX4]EAL64723.1 hypothetical protein DDB_G0285771 [Dictyostelium discoideum AX4]|eukprot:XP_638169.1 hypothetical protein DDB_G0285771 [Dictyostelium discoideum AX4]
MYKGFNFLFLILFLLLAFNISFIVSQNTISVNYNVQRNYNSFEECGLIGEPVCTSLEDAGNRAILLSKTSNPTNFINIIGNIDGSTPVTFGNLYNYCGRLFIRSSNSNISININGSNSTQQPFLTIQEADQPNSTFPCSIPRIFQFQYINFTNWNQTLVNININHETDLNSVNPSKSLTVYFQLVNIISSSSILKIYPKNFGENYNLQAITVAYLSTIGIDLKSSSVLFLPNSTQFYLPPIYLVGASIISILSLSDSTFESTPFIFSDNGSVSSVDSEVSNNNFYSYPFIMAVNGGKVLLPILSFTNNSLSTFVYFSNFNNQPSIKVTFSNNIFGNSFIQNSKFMKYKYENSIFVIKDSDFSTIDLLGYSILNQNTITNDLIYIVNSSLNLDNSVIRSPMLVPQHIINSINSSVSIINFNLTISELPIVGYNSNIHLFSSVFTNNVYCGCQGCSYYIQLDLVNLNQYSSQ